MEPTLRSRYRRGIALLDSVTLVSSRDGLCFVTARPFALSPASASERALALALQDGLGWDELDAVLERSRSRTLVLELHRRGLLTEPIERSSALSSQLHWLAHHTTTPEVAQAELANSRAVIVGCGGTGSILAEHLAAMGVGALVLVDFDDVERSNLGRQFPFTLSDIGSCKATALRRYLRDRHPRCEVTVHRRRITDKDTLVSLARDAEALLCCADTPTGTIAAVVAEAALELDAVAVFGSVGLNEGAVGPLLTSADASARFIAEMRELEALEVLGRAAMRATFAPVNTIVAAWMAGAWARFRLGIGDCHIENRTLIVDVAGAGIRVERTWDAALSEAS